MAESSQISSLELKVSQESHTFAINKGAPTPWNKLKSMHPVHTCSLLSEGLQEYLDPLNTSVRHEPLQLTSKRPKIMMFYKACTPRPDASQTGQAAKRKEKKTHCSLAVHKRDRNTNLLPNPNST